MATNDTPAGARGLKARWLLDHGKYKEAVAEFKAAGTTLTPDELLDYAVKCLRRGWASVATMALLDVREQPSDEDWLECGRLCLKHGWLEEADTAYANAGGWVPRKAVVACAYKFLDGGDTDAALEVFKRLDSAKGYVACGKAFLRCGSLREGVGCYALAGRPAPAKLLAECGRGLLMRGVLDFAREAYAAAGQPITRELCIEAGDRLMFREWEQRAEVAYAEAERLAVTEQ